MAQIGDFVWSDGMITSLDQEKENPSDLYQFKGRAIGQYTGTNKLRIWDSFQYEPLLYSSKDDPLVCIKDLKILAPFLKLPICSDSEVKQFITELTLWCLAREYDKLSLRIPLSSFWWNNDLT